MHSATISVSIVALSLTACLAISSQGRAPYTFLRRQSVQDQNCHSVCASLFSRKSRDVGVSLTREMDSTDKNIDFSKVMMPPEEVSNILRILKEIYVRTGGRMSYLEFGSGGSTTEFTKYANVAVSIEHDKEWCQLVAERLKSAELRHVLQRCVAKEDVEHGGSEGDNISFRRYLDAIDGRGLPKSYDFVLIDGRARLGAALKVLPYIGNDSVVIIHDAVRKRYDDVSLYYAMEHQNMSQANAPRLQNGYKAVSKRQDINESLPLSHERIQAVYAQIHDIEA